MSYLGISFLTYEMNFLIQLWAFNFIIVFLYSLYTLLQMLCNKQTFFFTFLSWNPLYSRFQI